MSQEILKNFDFEGQQVRTVMQDNEPWFVLTDVCKVLEIKQPRTVKARLEQDIPESVGSINALAADGKMRKTATVNESGLYDVILDSRKPQAKEFRRWVTSEVIPSIRKHGVYMTEEVRAEAMISPDFLRDIAHTLEEEIQKREALEAELEEVAPKVAFADAVEASDESITLTETAQLLTSITGGMGRVKFIRYLRDNGYLYRRNVSGNVLPRKKYLDNGIFEVVESGYWDNSKAEWVPVVQTRVTGKGQIHFLNLFAEEEEMVIF